MNDASRRENDTTHDPHIAPVTSSVTTERKIPSMCQHQPPCPPADSTARDCARLVAHHPEQGWSLLCNGVLLFEDTGELLPEGSVIAPHRPLGPGRVVAVA